MPQTRRNTPRADKVDELLDAAESLFRERGFPGTTTAQIAKAAKVSERTLFWYFPSKDHVLVAVVERAAARIDASLRRRGWPTDDPAEDLYRVLQAMRALRHLLPAMHQRAEASKHVADARRRFGAAHRRGIAAVLRELGTPEEDLEASTVIVTCFVDGVLLRNVRGRELRRLCETLVDRLRPRRGGPARSRAART